MVGLDDRDVPIGQGIAVTPVQMAAAYAAVANDGVWLRPHLVDRVGAHASGPVGARRILSPGVARQVLKMMEDVVIEGTGEEATLPGYQVAGKTGTAAKPDPSGGYSTSRVRRLVRRDRARDESARSSSWSRSTSRRRDLGRRRRRSGVPADRPLRPPVPGSPAGRPLVVYRPSQ